MPDRDALLKKIQETHFAAHEIALYLDTHPDDSRMYPYFQQYDEELQELRAQYESLYGPLLVNSGLQNNRWAWLDSPWPWDL